MTINALTTTARRPRLAAGLACCATMFLGLNGAAEAQREAEPLAILSPIGFDRCDDGVCTIDFAGLPECAYTIFVSDDLVTWEPLGFFVEILPGQFEYVDPAAADQPSRYYQIEVHFAPPAQDSLPPQLEQLRLELGDEAFGQWLEQNQLEIGNNQGIPEETVLGMTPEELDEFERIEQMLEDFLNDLHGTTDPPLVLPPYIETFEIMGEEAFVEALNENFIDLGNYQGVCGTALVEMFNLYPDLHLEFLEVELQLEEFLEELQEPQLELPPQLEQLRMELGDEGFAQWLQVNMQQWGNYQGIAESAVQDMQSNFPDLYQEFLQTEQKLEQWLAGME